MTITAARVALGATAFAVPAVAALGLSQLDAPTDEGDSGGRIATVALATGIGTMGVGASTMLHGPVRAYTLLAGLGLTAGGITAFSLDG